MTDPEALPAKTPYQDSRNDTRFHTEQGYLPNP